MASHVPKFGMSPVDAVDLIYRSLRKLERTKYDHKDSTDEGIAALITEVEESVSSLLSKVVYQLREPRVVFDSTQRESYDTLVKFVS